jgi:antitoxin HicB
MRYLVIIMEDLEDGGYNASCPALPGCHSEGASIEEAMGAIREAIACYLESLAIDDQPAPAPTPVITEVEVAVSGPGAAPIVGR